MQLGLRSAALLAASLALCSNCGISRSWSSPGQHATEAPRTRQADDDVGRSDALVRSLPVCISAVWSAGELGARVLYHYRRDGRRLSVGYFVYWTAERPWGPNSLSYWVLPALLIDAFYSHLLFVFPGAQQVIYGPGDVEGARIVYEQNDDGRWLAISGVADNVMHEEVALAPDGLLDRDGAVVLRSDVWSHQLGGRGDARGDDANRPTCFTGAALSPLTREAIETFRLGSARDPRRAGPAWNLDAAPTLAGSPLAHADDPDLAR